MVLEPLCCRRARTWASASLIALEEAGLGAGQIGVTLRDRTAQGELVEDTGTKAAEGATTGALAIPGVGPVVAGGMLASALGIAGGTAAAGAGFGAVAGGLVGALVGLGIPEEEAKHFESSFRSGHALVTVKAGSGLATEAVDILRAYGGDIGPAGTRYTTTTGTYSSTTRRA